MIPRIRTVEALDNLVLNVKEGNCRSFAEKWRNCKMNFGIENILE